MKMHSFWLGLMLVVVSSSVFAGPNIGLKGIGGRLGYVDPEGGDGTFTLGAVADMGTWTENLPWEIALTYWGTGENVGLYEWNYTNIAIRITVDYMFEVGKNMYVYPGAGLGINIYSFDWKGPNGTKYDDSETDLTLMVLGGFQFPISDKWHGQTELQFDIGDPDQTTVQFDFIYELGKK